HLRTLERLIDVFRRTQNLLWPGVPGEPVRWGGGSIRFVAILHQPHARRAQLPRKLAHANPTRIQRSAVHNRIQPRKSLAHPLKAILQNPRATHPFYNPRMRLRPRTGTLVKFGAAAGGSLAIGAIAFGAAAIGTLAVGRIAIGKLKLKLGQFEKLHVDELTVDHLIVRNPTDINEARHSQSATQKPGFAPGLHLYSLLSTSSP